MSHAATNWAVQQRGISLGAKLVLWHLADRHHRDMGCFPSQATLAEDCEMSRSSVNNHLSELERAGLIRRIQRSDRTTKRQQSTLYIFAFEDRFQGGTGGEHDGPDRPEKPREPCPKSGHGAVSKKTPTRVQNSGKAVSNGLDTNLEENLERTARGAPKKRFFTDDERFEARELARFVDRGGVPVVENVPRRIRACLISQKLLDEAVLRRVGFLPEVSPVGDRATC